MNAQICMPVILSCSTMIMLMYLVGEPADSVCSNSIVVSERVQVLRTREKLTSPCDVPSTLPAGKAMCAEHAGIALMI